MLPESSKVSEQPAAYLLADNKSICEGCPDNIGLEDSLFLFLFFLYLMRELWSKISRIRQ